MLSSTIRISLRKRSQVLLRYHHTTRRAPPRNGDRARARWTIMVSVNAANTSKGPCLCSSRLSSPSCVLPSSHLPHHLTSHDRHSQQPCPTTARAHLRTLVCVSPRLRPQHSPSCTQSWHTAPAVHMQVHTGCRRGAVGGCCDPGLLRPDGLAHHDVWERRGAPGGWRGRLGVDHVSPARGYRRRLLIRQLLC